MKAAYDQLVSLLERVFGSGGILAYHGVGQESFAPWAHVQADVLRWQLVQLRDRYEFLPLVEFVERLRRGRSVLGCLAVTFDDAYAGVCRYASPVLSELSIPATIFVCSSAAQTGGTYWWDLVDKILAQRDEDRWNRLLDFLELEGLPMDDPQASKKIKSRVFSQCAGRGKELCKTLDSGKTDPADPWRSATLRELATMATDDHFDFGCHTASHPVLPFLPSEEQEREIREAHDWLSLRLPRVRPFLAYPYGLYDRRTSEIATRCGMVAGFTIGAGIPSRSDFPMHIPRLCVQQSTRKSEVRKRLSRAHRISRILVRGRHPRLPARNAYIDDSAQRHEEGS